MGAKAPIFKCMSTKIDICNAALSILGEEGMVTSLQPATGPYAGACANFYPIALKRLLEEFNWAFCIKSAKLAKLSTFFDGLMGHRNAFSVPSDCVRIIGVYDQAKPDTPQPFAVEFFSDNDTEVVLTDVEEPILKYVIYQDTPSLFPGYFEQALIFLLASYLVGQIKRDELNSQRVQSLNAMYKQALSDARTLDAQLTSRYKTNYVASQLRERAV